MKHILKYSFLALMLLVAFGAGAQQKQSLKDLLYSGKLKSDSNSVVRKSDDLTLKTDTAAKKPASSEPAKNVAATVDTTVGKAVPAVAATNSNDAATAVVTDVAANTETTTTAPAATPAKSNAKIWKEYTDSLAGTLKTEVLPSKKIKKDTYYLMVEYEIEPTGAVNILNVVSTPENAFLQDAVKSQMTVSPPQLQPAMDSSNKPRKVKRKQNFSITKE